jgi:hypothetical protein
MGTVAYTFLGLVGVIGLHLSPQAGRGARAAPFYLKTHRNVL